MGVSSGVWPWMLPTLMRTSLSFRRKSGALGSKCPELRGPARGRWGDPSLPSPPLAPSPLRSQGREGCCSAQSPATAVAAAGPPSPRLYVIHFSSAGKWLSEALDICCCLYPGCAAGVGAGTSSRRDCNILLCWCCFAEPCPRGQEGGWTGTR